MGVDAQGHGHRRADQLSLRLQRVERGGQFMEALRGNRARSGLGEHMLEMRQAGRQGLGTEIRTGIGERVGLHQGRTLTAKAEAQATLHLQPSLVREFSMCQPHSPFLEEAIPNLLSIPWKQSRHLRRHRQE